MASVREGDSGAFEVIVDRYQARLLGFCRQMLRSTEDAEDVLQEVFVNAYRAMVADNREINLRPWLYRIARNRCLNHLRRPTADAKESMDMVPMADEASTAETVHNREEFRQLLDDVGKLPETQRTALLLREMDSLSYEDIAETMETTVPSVKSLLVRARMSLSEASEARMLSCEEVRLSLAEAAEGITKVSGSIRKHIRDCEECDSFRKQLRTDSKAFATIFPAGPLLALKAAVLGQLSGLFGSGSGVGTGAGSAAGASSAATGATASTGVTAGAAATSATAGGAAAAGAAAVSAGGGAMGGALGAKAVAGVMTAAVITAGAVEVNNRSQPNPVPSKEDAIVRQVDQPTPKSPAIVPVAETVIDHEQRDEPTAEATAAEAPNEESDAAISDDEVAAEESTEASNDSDTKGAEDAASEDAEPTEKEIASASNKESREDSEGGTKAPVDPNSDVIQSPANQGEGIKIGAGEDGQGDSAPTNPPASGDKPSETDATKPAEKGPGEDSGSSDDSSSTEGEPDDGPEPDGELAEGEQGEVEAPADPDPGLDEEPAAEPSPSVGEEPAADDSSQPVDDSPHSQDQGQGQADVQ